MAATVETQVIDGVPRGLSIGGEWRDAASGATLAATEGSCRTRRRRSAASSTRGLGREGGREGIEEHLETKYAAIAI